MFYVISLTKLTKMPGALIYTGKHMSEHKMCEKGSLFCGKTHKAENNLGQYAIFQEKRGDFVQIYSILPTQIYLGCQI